MGHFSVVPASYVFLRRDRSVLLQRRQNTGYMDDCWSAGAAGHVELGETAASAAIREAREELGVQVALEALSAVGVMQRTDGTENPLEQRVDWFFVCDVWGGEPLIREPIKCAELSWFRLDDLPVNLPAHERLALDALREGRRSAVLTYGF
ncbi:NUDIX domain-containing protein [Plantibacter sp. VKM Ac-2880]|uniref:NUDIX hydrolase n=1 Tax=Plantibacter sp. VKM Ac-2880 TaxID=2783827 RepID=UPI001890AD54|nr:NUDIX domain-containing protein [Plantibacter sp. VKM Ac-2880]MBF4567363.1 NUDIX domain-containing protein [Plantibacter sp. VKM Ac-2880]